MKAVIAAPDMLRKIAWDRFILLGASQGKNAGRSSLLAGKRCRGQDYSARKTTN